MPDEFTTLVTALKSLTQTENDSEITLPVGVDEWYTRPDVVSYGIVRLDFEADALRGDNVKQTTSYEGSVDLFSLVKSGAGWVELITQTLTEYCGGSWSLNSHIYERETSLFHWEWTFEVSG